MIRIVVVVLFSIVLLPLKTFGQIENFGVKVGVQSAGVYSNPSMDGRVAGFGFYVFTDWQLSESLFNTIDFGISRKGFSNTQNQTDETGQLIREAEANTYTYYLSLASILNFDINLADLQSYVGFGPRIDWLIDKSLGEYGPSPWIDYTASDLDKFVFGGSFVLGIKSLSLQGVNFRLEGKYEVDISDSFSDFPRNYRNNAFMLGVGVSL